MRKIIENCPTCQNHSLTITEVQCDQCGTSVRSRYQPTVFSRLSAENLRFVEIFVKNKGNVKEMERELGISYWTIRSRLDEVIDALGLGESAPPPSMPGSRRQVLDMLESGEIAVDQAAELLGRLSDA